MTCIDITEADDGTTVGVQVGDKLRLRLSDNPTTGYAWELEEVSTAAVVARAAEYGVSSPRPGSPGVASWIFDVVAPGGAEIRLKRRRPWEGDASVVARFAVTVEVGT